MAGQKAATANAPILSALNIHKSFGQNAVLKGIALTVSAGEVLALIGGNGAGNSTLMKIIMGIYQPDSGSIEIDGKSVHLLKPALALAHGIYMVPQEPMIFPNMTVEENILIGFDEKISILRSRLATLMDEVGWRLDMNRKASSLSIAEQQLVEILRGLLRNARLLILDEPTSALTFDEVGSLFARIADLKAKNIGIIYITHRLNEVFDIATHVAILRDGIVSLRGPVEDFTREMLVKGLLPPSMAEKGAEQAATPSAVLDYRALKPVLTVKNLSGYGFRNINLAVYPGEILGVAGVVGAGRTELATTIIGRDTILSGTVLLEDKDITGCSTAKAIQAGINYVPEDRHLHGLFKISDVAANTTSSILYNLSMGRFFLSKKTECNLTECYVQDFHIKVTGQDQITGSLSGGNQQKIVIGRALSTKPKLVILDEPTRGIDAAARAEVYTIIHKLRDQGVAIMLISSDMEEIIELADRVVTMYQGRINSEFSKEEINQDSLMSAAFGVLDGKQVRT